MVQKIAHLFKNGIYLPEIPQKASFGIWFAPKRHFNIERVTVQAAILLRAGSQMMGGVETETLGKFDHGLRLTRVGAHIAFRSGKVKDGPEQAQARHPARRQILRARKAHANWQPRGGGDSPVSSFS